MIKVIIVEDDPMVRMITEKFIASLGSFKIEATYGDGKEAFEYLLEGNGELLILDMYLPGMNGLEILKGLREKNISIDTIFVTASNSLEEIEEASQLGAVDYLIKPFNFSRMRDSLKKHIARREMLFGKESLTQQEVDRIFHYVANETTVSKGIQEITLKKIMKILGEAPNKEHSSKEVSEKLNTSVVTVKKYLDYLTETGRVESTLHYKSVGRPQCRYKLVM